MSTTYQVEVRTENNVATVYNGQDAEKAQEVYEHWHTLGREVEMISVERPDA